MITSPKRGESREHADRSALRFSLLHYFGIQEKTASTSKDFFRGSRRPPTPPRYALTANTDPPASIVLAPAETSISETGRMDYSPARWSLPFPKAQNTRR